MAQISTPDNQIPSLEDRLTIDATTGLRNEHLFRLRLPDEFQRSREKETNGALIAIKLDNIIEINARHGRTGGDDAIRSLSLLLQNYRTGQGDETHLIFKLSGPIFGYFVPSCTSDQAQNLAEAILEQVGGSELFIEKISVSIGVVNLYEFFMSEEDLRHIAESIEKTALHRVAIAEKSGRNTICHVSATSDAVGGAEPCVLVVDPDPASIEFLLHGLQSGGFQVKTCPDGECAMSLIQESPPDAVICEAMTPRLNGFTIRERLRANVIWKSIPFILISHKKTEEYVQKAVDLDIRHYLRKPIFVTEIVGLITNIMRNRHD